MDHAKWEEPIKGVVIGAIFCLAYLTGWFNSLDQWYLPAGVRVAAFLLLPYRYWPYLLAGDCAAMLLLRVPRIPTNSATWVYSSSILIPMIFSLGIVGIRARFRSLQAQSKWIPLIAGFMAVWGSLGTWCVNTLLGGPADGTTLEFFYLRCVGHFLAILAITLPAMLWLGRRDGTPKPRHFLRDALLSGITIAAIFCSIVIPEKVGDYLRIGLMLMMLIPIIFMTFRHGWRGAAIGISASCFAVIKTLYYFNTEGAYDAPVFIVQHTLVIASFGLLALGHVISSQYATARALGIAEKEALQVSRIGFLAAEPMLRDKAQTMEQMQLHIDSERKRVADYLKSIGDFEGALLLNNESVEHNSRFGAYATDLYPLRLEKQGLNAVLNSKEFSDARGGGAHVLPLLGPNPTHLSLELQLVAYRCVGNAIDVLSELQPRAYVIKTRVRKMKRHRGIALIVTVRDSTQTQSTPKSAKAAIELTARVRAHGGVVKRRHAHRISLWISELIEQPAAD
jgi:MASE1